jgi:hypothetical protein
MRIDDVHNCYHKTYRYAQYTCKQTAKSHFSCMATATKSKPPCGGGLEYLHHGPCES